jgi:AcrR family transcriptional regulator
MARPPASRAAPRPPAPDQREKLIAATERLLCSRGLGCVSTRDIARAAKVAEGALYHHFDDKAGLILSVVLHQLGDFPEVLQNLPLQIGLNTVQKNLERVLESAFAFHHRIAPLVCSLFADQDLLARVRGMMNERSMGPGRAAFAIAAYLRAEQQLGRVAQSAVPETVAELMIAVSFNTALQDHFFHGGSEPKGKAHQRLRDAVRALTIGLLPPNGDERAVAKGARK